MVLAGGSTHPTPLCVEHKSGGPAGDSCGAGFAGRSGAGFGWASQDAQPILRLLALNTSPAAPPAIDVVRGLLVAPDRGMGRLRRISAHESPAPIAAEPGRRDAPLRSSPKRRD